MTLKHRVKVLVVGKNDVNESDRVFSVFAPDFGKMEILGKSIRKINSKLKGGMNIFSLSEIEFVQGKNRKTLTDAVLVKSFLNIIHNFDKMIVAGRIIKVLNLFVKGQENDERLFELLDNSFNKLNDENLRGGKNNFVYDYFLWNALSLFGYNLEVKKCVGCREKLIPHNIYFSAKEGGIICKKCFSNNGNAEEINSDIVKILRIILSKDWETLSRLRAQETTQELLFKISEKAVQTFCPANC